MKTIRDWLEELPEPYKTQAIDNAPENNLKCQDDSLHEALAGAFFWSYTKEGYDYWDNLYTKLKHENR